MVLGPYWHGELGESSVSSADVERTAVDAAERLMQDLDAAAKATEDWQQETLAEYLVDELASRCLSTLAATGCWGKQNEPPSRRFWEIAGGKLQHGALLWRARSKPRGYAGDFEMMTSICFGSRCDHPLGKALDRLFLNQAAPRAVHARTEQTAAALAAHAIASEQRELRVLSVGCGPAIDIVWALEALPESARDRIRVALLELDEDALTAARVRLNPLLPDAQVSAQRENLFRLPSRRALAETTENVDFAICSGLFDYLEPDPAAELLSWLYGRLRPGGRLLVGNFAPHCTTRAFMEWIGNWYLIYRTPAEMRELARAAGIPDECFSVGAERVGINLFLNAWK